MRRSWLAAVASLLAVVGLVPHTAAAGTTPPVGTVRQWIALDDFNGIVYRKDYTLRGVGDRIELWIATDPAFPAGDCRSQIPNTTVVTDAQVADLITQFDTNIYPDEVDAFSTPPDRDGSNAMIGPDGNGNGGDYSGDGNKTVVLVDNVRDGNFYTFPAALDYNPGFFSAQFNELLDRNVITLDAFDWQHRTGANPPDDPTADPCTSRPALPSFYESVLAREWQKLAHYYADPLESAWVNEGLSGFAQTLTGYVDSTATVFDRGFNRDLVCFQGFGIVQTPFNPAPAACGGPENSLTSFHEGGPNGGHADRGISYAFMLFLFDRYGTDFISTLHQDDGLRGLASVDAALDAAGVPDLYGVIHDFQSMVLLDQIIGDAPRASFRDNTRHSLRARRISGSPKSRVTTPSLRSTVNLDNPDAYDDPGAAPNGADYVPLQAAGGQLLTGKDLKSVSFAGAATLPPTPLAWSIVTNDPSSPGDPVLFSGNGNNLDVTAVTSVAVPTIDPTLRLQAKYGAEFGFDFGYVQVSTDGGATYTSIAGDRTISGPLGPALNGTTNGFEPHSFDLAAYAGQTILVALRYVSDGGVNEGGLLVDDMSIGGTTVSDGSSLDPFDSVNEVHPHPVHNWNLRIVGFNADVKPKALQIEFDGVSTAELSKSEVRRLRKFEKLVAIVAYDEPTEQLPQYAPYTLTVNGVVQPGGAP